MSWLSEYQLSSDGTFVMSGYPPIEMTGRYAVAEQSGARLRLVFTGRVMAGSPAPDLDTWAEISADGQTLSFDDRVFQRQ